MTGAWQSLCRLVLREAKSWEDHKRDLLKYITRRYGEHEADEVQADLKRMGFKAWRSHMATKYMSDDIDRMVKDMATAGLAQLAKQRAKSGEGEKSKREPGEGESQGPSGRNYKVTPDQAAQKQAGIDQMKQARATAGQGGQSAAQALMTPGKGGAHAVGTAGQHQPKQQPSVAQGIEPTRDVDPETGARLRPRSGLVDAQRRVDRETKQKGAAAGDKLAAELGVPTTAERTTTDDDGEEHVHVWPPERVLKFMDPDQNPEKGGGKSDAEKRAQSHARATNDPGEMQRRLDMIKQGVVSRQAAPKTAELGPKRKGSYHGEPWQPHGQEGEKMVNRPDKATGNWIRGKMPVDPSKTGQTLKWNEYDGQWQLPSVFASREGERLAKSGAEPAKPYSRSGDRDVKAAGEKAADTELMRKLAGSPRLQQQVRDLARKRGISLGGDQDDDEDDEYPESQGWRKQA